MNKSKECFVAFIDILGFSDMIDKDQGTGEYLKKIKEAIEKGQSLLKDRQFQDGHTFSFWFKEFGIKSFSDCFCFSIPLEFDRGEKDYKQNFLAFYVWIHVFYNELLNLGFLCRGGISQGWHYSDENIIFSKALVDAYKIESKLATYPIIMIDKNLISKLKSKYSGDEKYFEYMFAHDTAGRNFLNPFNYSIVDELFFNDEQRLNLENHIAVRNELIELHLETIAKKMKVYKGLQFIEKYQWLKEFMNFTLNKSHNDKFKNGLDQ